MLFNGVGVNFHRLLDIRQILEHQLQLYLWALGTLRTLGQHEFEFGFCGSVEG